MKKNLLILISLFCAIFFYELAHANSDVTTEANPQGPIFYGYCDDDGNAYAFCNEEETELKFIEPFDYTEGPTPDSFSGYRKSIYRLQPNLIIDGKECRVVSIGEYSIRWPEVAEFYFPETLLIVESSNFNNLRSFHKVGFNEGLRVIMNYCFNRNECLKSIELPNSLYEIQDDCFSDNGLESVKFGGSLHYIGKNCFNNNYFST